MKYKLKNRIWIEGDSGTFLAQGRVELLKNIDETGSINKACKKMHMSYKKAWELVDSINEQSKKPLVIKISGGKGGGGTQLTSEGHNAIRKFEKLQSIFTKYIEKEFNSVKHGFE